MSMSYVDSVVEDIDWKLLREQKAYCVNEAENDSENGHIYEGLVHLLDELQDAAIDDGIVTATEVFLGDDES